MVKWIKGILRTAAEVARVLPLSNAGHRRCCKGGSGDFTDEVSNLSAILPDKLNVRSIG